MARGIKLNLKGFEKTLHQLQEAGKDAEKAAAQAIRESAEVFEQELKSECAASKVPASISSEIRTKVTQDGQGRYVAEVGWELGPYRPNDPSEGYKAVFLNYGTPKRQAKAGRNRGRIEARGFIGRAKKKARTKVKRIQKRVLEEALVEG